MIATSDILNALTTHASTLGVFSRVLAHDPHNKPGSGKTCTITFLSVSPVQSSGLASTSALFEWNVRIMIPNESPDDAIDLDLMNTMDLMMAEYSGDFDLGGLVRSVDLMGIHSGGLAAIAGHLVDGGPKYRVVDINLPLIINDVWDQVA